MQHIIIRSSRADSNVLQTNDWITNGANLTGELYIKKKKKIQETVARFFYMRAPCRLGQISLKKRLWKYVHYELKYFERHFKSRSISELLFLHYENSR